MWHFWHPSLLSNRHLQTERCVIRNIRSISSKRERDKSNGICSYCRKTVDSLNEVLAAVVEKESSLFLTLVMMYVVKNAAPCKAQNICLVQVNTHHLGSVSFLRFYSNKSCHDKYGNGQEQNLEWGRTFPYEVDCSAWAMIKLLLYFRQTRQMLHLPEENSG